MAGRSSNVASAVSLGTGWVWDSSCTGLTGHPVVGQNNSSFINNSGHPLPNTGSFKLFAGSQVFPRSGSDDLMRVGGSDQFLARKFK